MANPVAAEIVLSEDERATLERWARRPKSAQSLALRCRVVLACADGATNTEVAERLRVNRTTVAKWRGRFADHGFDSACMTSPGPGAPRTVTDEDVPARAVPSALRSLSASTSPTYGRTNERSLPLRGPTRHGPGRLALPRGPCRHRLHQQEPSRAGGRAPRQGLQLLTDELRPAPPAPARLHRTASGHELLCPDR